MHFSAELTQHVHHLAPGDVLVFHQNAKGYRRGQRIVWGRPPGQEKPGEPDAEAKTVRLLDAIQAGGSADLRELGVK